MRVRRTGEEIIKSVIKLTSILVLSATLCGCINYEKILSATLSDSTKQNAAACDSGYREACERLMASGCTSGTSWPVCRVAVETQSRSSASLKTKCSQDDNGACYTLARIDCGKGDASACNVLKTTDPATLESECKSGDQLACADHPAGAHAAGSMIIGSQ